MVSIDQITELESNTVINSLDFSGETTVTITLTGGSCWRTLTSPVAGETYAAFFQRFRTNSTDYGGLWTQGTGITGARATSGTPNEYTLNSTGNDWIAVQDLNQVIPAGTGILMTIFDRDDFANGASTGFPKTATILETEAENSSPVTVNLGSLAGTSNASEAFSMLGNPFKSTIDFNDLIRNDVQEIAWIYNRNAGGFTNGSNGGWISWNGSSGDIAGGLITLGQGFVVQNMVSPTSPSVVFPESAKELGGTFYGREQNCPDYVRLEVQGEQLYSSMWL